MKVLLNNHIHDVMGDFSSVQLKFIEETVQRLIMGENIQVENHHYHKSIAFYLFKRKDQIL